MVVGIIGSGITGATIARVLAEAGEHVVVYEAHDEVGGHVRDTLYHQTPVSTFGPHIFHTDDPKIWAFVNRFTSMRTLVHRVESLTDVGWLPWPINHETLRKAFAVTSVSEAKTLMRQEQEESIVSSTASFESQGYALAGKTLYTLMIKHYTEKQWGVPAPEVPASVLTRVRINDSNVNRFFDDKFQGIPEPNAGGYTGMVAEMLAHANITVLRRTFIEPRDLPELRRAHNVVVSTAPPDALLDNELGKLDYHAVEFITVKTRTQWPTPIVNFATAAIPFTRATDYGRLYNTDDAIAVLELPGSQDGEPLYPVRTALNVLRAQAYIAHLRERFGIISAGRLGAFEYLDMAPAIARAQILAQQILEERTIS